MRSLLLTLLTMLLLSFIGAGEGYAQNQPMTGSTYTDANGNTVLVDVNDTIDPGECGALRTRLLTNPDGGVDKLIRVSAGGTICPCVAGKVGENLWIERIVACFADIPGGLLYNSVRGIIQNPKYVTFYSSILFASISLAMILFGLRLSMGAIQNLPKDTFVLLLKIGFVVLFFNNYLYVFGQLLNAVDGFTEIVNKAVGQLGNVCDASATAPGGKPPTIWARWDCLMRKFTGLVGDYVGFGILGYMAAFLFSGGAGTAVFFGLGYVIVTILTLAMRMVYTYLVAIMGISFLFLLAPLFVPLLFFGMQYQRFATWFKMILAYSLQPMMIFLFAAIMLVTLEFAIFVGPHSLFGALSNKKAKLTEAVTFQEAMGVGNGAGSLAAAVTGSTEDWTKFIQYKTVLGGTRYHDPGAISTGANAGDQGHAERQQSNDMIRSYNSPTDPTNTDTPDSEPFGFILPVADCNTALTSLIINGGGTITCEQWYKQILLSIFASSVLVFILYNLVHAVPQITHDLISQNLRGFGINKARMIGESELKKSVDMAKESVRRDDEEKRTGKKRESVLMEAIGSYAQGKVTEKVSSLASNRGGGAS